MEFEAYRSTLKSAQKIKIAMKEILKDIDTDHERDKVIKYKVIRR